MYVLALDVGSSSVRARVYDELGRELDAAAQRIYSADYGRDGSAVLDAERLVEASRQVLDEARAGAPPVAAVAISCFWHSLLALDSSNNPLTPVLLWQDRRSARQAAELAERLDSEEVHRRTGCVLHTSYWPAKLAWLAAEHQEVSAKAERLVSFADYLFLRLTGELRTSLSTASGTGLLDLRARTWDAGLLEVLELGAEQLPPISDEPSSAQEPVFPPVGDGACSNLGAGCAGPQRAALMIGTSGAFRVLRETRDPGPRPGLFCYLLDDEHMVEGGAVSDGGNLYAWLKQTLQLDGASLGEPDGHGLTFLPLLGGERSPGWNTKATGAVAGLTFDVRPGDLLQAALEGVAYRFAELAELLPEVEEIVATGHALLVSPEWVQLCADVLGRPVTASAVAEGSARGAAVYGLERLGAEPEDAPLGPVHEPDPERGEVYAAARERQRDLYRRLF
ncbi:MAG TPA: gluconokinase [Gaiellaceae bacterium]|jgi:gluconokinase|nr:gluconokinase [Gaiellaceae bacterium]